MKIQRIYYDRCSSKSCVYVYLCIHSCWPMTRAGYKYKKKHFPFKVVFHADYEGIHDKW